MPDEKSKDSSIEKRVDIKYGNDSTMPSSKDKTDEVKHADAKEILDAYYSKIYPSSSREHGGYPTGLPAYVQRIGGPINPHQHTLKPISTIDNIFDSHNNFFVKDKTDHFIRDVSQGMVNENRTGFVNEDEEVERRRYIPNTKKNEDVAVFSGATTNVNPHNDPVTAKILASGTFSEYLEDDLGEYIKPPVSPLAPFTRMGDKKNQHTAEEAIFNTYNRTKLPIADVEWRKGFRHIFITRPECYLMGFDEKGILGLCDQSMYDEDFNSAWMRMPHIIKLLSPWYVSGSFPKNSTKANWNFLLSNRVQGLSTAATTISINENIAKSTEGFTITPAMHVESRQGSTLELTFKDTKTLEVFEMARLWMLYMYKRKKGIFIPPYNGYQKTNGFIEIIGDKQSMTKDSTYYTRYHPYDRALEYCASLYDIVTNESGTKILYWCKYYGIYPTSVTPSLSNSNNGPITDMTTTISFKYHYRLENVNKTLVEFNHDTGLVDSVGRVCEEVTTDSMSFLLRNEYDNPVMKKYIGAAGMFTGSPYIVMQQSHPDPLDKSNIISVPNLRFMNIIDNKLNGRLNLGINNTEIEQKTYNVVGYF